MTARTALLFLMVLLVPLAAGADDSPLAILMAQEGEVMVMRSGDALDATFGMHLDQGDEIRTGEESMADIVFATGQVLQLGANGRLVVQGTDAAAAGGTSPSIATAADGIVKLQGKRGTSAMFMRGDKTDEIIAVSPRDGQAVRLSTRPVFRWSGGSGEMEFRLLHGSEVVWSGTVTDVESLVYPADAPALSGGESYSWFVATADPLLPPAQTQTAFFETLTAEEEAALDESLASLEQAPVSPSTRAVLAAGLLFDEGLVDEAVGVVDAAIESDDDAGLRSIRDGLRAANWP